MSTFIFIYQGREIVIPCKQKEDINQIVQRFCIKVGVNKENLNFLCNGKILDENITEDKISMNQNGTKIIIVDYNSVKVEIIPPAFWESPFFWRGVQTFT